MAYQFPWKYSRRALPPKQVQVYTMLGITVFTLILFGAFAIRPTLATVAELRRKIGDEEAALAKLTQKIKDLSKAQITLSNQPVIPTLAQSALPSEKELPRLIETITAVAEKRSLRLSRLSFEPPQEYPIALPNQKIKVSAQPFTLQIEGNFPDLLGMIADLEKNLRLMDVEAIRVANRDRGVETYNLKVLTYFSHD